MTRNERIEIIESELIDLNALIKLIDFGDKYSRLDPEYQDLEEEIWRLETELNMLLDNKEV